MSNPIPLSTRKRSPCCRSIVNGIPNESDRDTLRCGRCGQTFQRSQYLPSDAEVAVQSQVTK